MIIEGFCIETDDGRFVSSIISNGHPENPVVYFTRDLAEVKVWKTMRAARKAYDRIHEKIGGCVVCGVEERSENIVQKEDA